MERINGASADHRPRARNRTRHGTIATALRLH